MPKIIQGKIVIIDANILTDSSSARIANNIINNENIRRKPPITYKSIITLQSYDQTYPCYILLYTIFLRRLLLFIIERKL